MKNKMYVCFVSLLVVLSLPVVANTQEIGYQKPELEQKGSWSLIMVPDTQNYVKWGRNQPILDLMMAWIEENIDPLNIKMVVIVGDLVNNNEKIINDYDGNQTTQQQWEAVSQALAKLDGKTPYIAASGNHDYSIDGQGNRSSRYSEFVTTERNSLNQKILVQNNRNEQGRPTLENSACEIKNLNGRDYLFLTVEYAPRDSIVEWAGKIAALEQYRNHRIVLVTHGYLNAEDQRTGPDPIRWIYWEPYQIDDKIQKSQLQANYVLKADDPKMRTRVPTLKQYLEECRRQGLLPFIEPKLTDPSGEHYRDIIRLAGEVLGRGHYIITSNNRANRAIRSLGIKNVQMMGILHQTTFEDIAEWGNAIMAIGASQFTGEQFAAHAVRSIAAGMPIESHADNYARFAVINAHPVNYVSTDELAPDLASGAKPLVDYADLSGFVSTGAVKAGGMRLAPGDSLTSKQPLPKVAFGGIYLVMDIKGACTLRLGHQEFLVDDAAETTVSHQLMVYDAAPRFEITARGECELKHISLKLVSF